MGAWALHGPSGVLSQALGTVAVVGMSFISDLAPSVANDLRGKLLRCHLLCGAIPQMCVLQLGGLLSLAFSLPVSPSGSEL